MPSLQALQTLSLGQASGIGGKKEEGVIQIYIYIYDICILYVYMCIYIYMCFFVHMK